MVSHEDKVKEIQTKVDDQKYEYDREYVEGRRKSFGQEHLGREARAYTERKYNDLNMNLMEEYLLGQDMLQQKIDKSQGNIDRAAQITANPQYRKSTKKSEERKTYNKALKEEQFALKAKESFTAAMEKAAELENLKQPEGRADELTKEQQKAELDRISKIEEVVKLRTEGQLSNIQYKAAKNNWKDEALEFNMKKSQISSFIFLQKEIEKSKLPEDVKEKKIADLNKQMEALNTFKWEKEEAKAKEKATQARFKQEAKEAAAKEKEEKAKRKQIEKAASDKENASSSTSGFRRWAYELGRIFTLNYGIIGGILIDHFHYDKLEKIANGPEVDSSSKYGDLQSNAANLATAEQNKPKSTNLESFIKFNRKVQEYATLQRVDWKAVGQGVGTGLKTAGKGIGIGLKWFGIGITFPIWIIPYWIHTRIKIAMGPDVPSILTDDTLIDAQENPQQNQGGQESN